MKSLIIHPKDSSTEFLSLIYKDMDDYTLVDTHMRPYELKKLIKSHDRVIMLGHGSELGLFDFKHLGFIIDDKFVHLLKQKTDSVYIWCNADVFVKKHGLKGFYTGMIISEEDEANMYNVKYSAMDLNESNQKFTLSIKESIDHIPALMVETVKNMYDNSINDIMLFNRNNIYYN